jgi:hypothetical protein
VSKHTTCNDVDGGGVKRLVEVPGSRCLRRDVDVDAVLIGMNKAGKHQNPNTHVNSKKFGTKRTHKSCQNLCQDNAKLYIKETNGCQKGYYGVETSQNDVNGSWWM